MSLIGALNIGSSAMAASQAAIQVTGNNIANAGDADYTRQVAVTEPADDQQIQPGIFIGTGVNLTSVQRQIDESLDGRLRSAVSDDEAAGTSEDWLGRVESTFNELSDQDISTQMSTFFSSWSNLANKPQDLGLRQVVIQDGQSLAQSIQGESTQLGSLQGDVNQQITALAGNADSLAQQIAGLNGQIVTAQGGSGGTANGLLDQRDALLKQLSQLMDVKTVQQSTGVTNVYVGSEPLVIGTENLGVGTTQTSVNGQVQTSLIFKSNNGTMSVTTGQLGALQGVQGSISGVMNQLDGVAKSIVYELNKVHSSGQGLEGFTSTAGSNDVDDPAAALTSKTSGLTYLPTSGSFVVHVTNSTSGLTSSTLVQIDNTTTLQSLQASLNAIPNLSATISGGQLSIQSNSPDVQFSFSQDSSGVLASLGINNFFTGTKASNIAVNQQIVDDPSLLAASQNGDPGDNQTAVAISNLETTPLNSLNGSTLEQQYQTMINGVSTTAAAAKSNAQAASNVRQTLEAQRDSLSGVSLDEETVNLMTQQRAFQGAARLISTVNQLMESLMNM